MKLIRNRIDAKRNYVVFWALFFSFFIFSAFAPYIVSADSGADGSPMHAVIYKNEACGHCNMYIMNLRVYLESMGFAVEEKFMVNDPAIREEVNNFHVANDIPIDMQGHLITIINDKLVLEGHVPLPIVKDVFDKYPTLGFEKLVIYQDLMAEMEDLKSYKTMDAAGVIKDCEIKEKVTDCANVDAKGTGEIKLGSLRSKSMLPLILVSGFLDGINPCAFAVLLFFISFLFALKKTKQYIFKVGAVYIFAIFLAYILIGLGLLKAMIFINTPHLMAKVGAYLVIILGLVNIKDYFWYGKWFTLNIPVAQKKYITTWVHKATIPSAFVLGFLVGLCTFPCSGGIYVAILGILTVKTTYVEGMMYLVLYNIMFVMPLIIILLMASNKKAVEKLEKWQKSEKENMKLVSGIVMIILGLIILYGGILH